MVKGKPTVLLVPLKYSTQPSHRNYPMIFCSSDVPVPGDNSESLHFFSAVLKRL